jgi:hypothetical protein
MEETGRLRRIWICCFDEERQLGKPGEIGRPCWRIVRRSGGKLRLNFDLRSENSDSVSPCSIIMLDDLRCLIRLFAYVVNEKHILRFDLGGFEIDDFVVVVV